jgi:hypothetical protein
VEAVFLDTVSPREAFKIIVREQSTEEIYASRRVEKAGEMKLFVIYRLILHLPYF